MLFRSSSSLLSSSLPCPHILTLPSLVLSPLVLPPLVLPTLVLLFLSSLHSFYTPLSFFYRTYLCPISPCPSYPYPSFSCPPSICPLPLVLHVLPPLVLPPFILHPLSFFLLLYVFMSYIPCPFSSRPSLGLLPVLSSFVLPPLVHFMACLPVLPSLVHLPLFYLHSSCLPCPIFHPSLKLVYCSTAQDKGTGEKRRGGMGGRLAERGKGMEEGRCRRHGEEKNKVRRVRKNITFHKVSPCLVG